MPAWAVVTDASNGIGCAFAFRLFLILVGRNPDKFRKVAIAIAVAVAAAAVRSRSLKRKRARVNIPPPSRRWRRRALSSSPSPPPPPPPPRRRYPGRGGGRGSAAAFRLSAPRRSRGGALRARAGDERARMLHGEGSLGFGSGGEAEKWEEEMEKEKKRKKGWVHFVGIGGSGVSALAMLALEQGFEVSGSDIKWSSFMDQLQRAGARLFIGHSIASFEGLTVSALPDAVVISSAIPKDNVEILHAKSVGIPIYKRDGWLKMITDKYNLIAVSGTHGLYQTTFRYLMQIVINILLKVNLEKKSTTAAMLSYVLDSMGDNPIAVVGANVPQFSGGNIISGSGPNFVLEADEYDSCFLGLSPYIAVVTNVEWDHVDIFPDEGAVQNIFRQFVHRIRTGGHLILCGDR
uniref:Mur ligase N-terminal catalytic domain-containing protein n=1 Tax=Ananas comosus var. bracteatus TaxID=296719 RepID=A0A6V7NQ34_ANACO|nr:unnamed protein product [Ananas comosus var. bracteatus]